MLILMALLNVPVSTAQQQPKWHQKAFISRLFSIQPPLLLLLLILIQPMTVLLQRQQQSTTQKNLSMPITPY